MNLLFLTHRLPYAPNRGDRLRAYHTLHFLRTRANVTLVSFVHDEEEEAKEDAMKAQGFEVRTVRIPKIRSYVSAALQLGGRRPLTHLLLDAPRMHATLANVVEKTPPDVVFAYCSGMARLALEAPLSRFPLVIDFVDVDSQKWAALAESAHWPIAAIYRREERTLAAFEREAAQVAHASLVVNERERTSLLALAPTANVEVVPNGLAIPESRPGLRTTNEPCVVFCGVMNYAPNVEAVLWFAREIWPLVRARRADATFLVVGSNPTHDIMRLSSADRGIEVTGTVPDVGQYLANALVAVAPLKTARGVQNKVLEALGYGLPCVVTSPVLEGLPQGVRAGCLVADQVETFAEKTLSLLAMESAERQQLVSRANLGSLAWDEQLRVLPKLLADATRAPATASSKFPSHAVKPSLSSPLPPVKSSIL